MATAQFAITVSPLDQAAVAAAAASGLETVGAIATFTGLVRGENVGRRVLFLEYEAYEPLAIRSFELIAEEARSRWPSARLAIHHRTGRLEVGEVSVVIAVASPHRGAAFEVCRYAIERVKQIAPIWKHEHFEGGDVWIEGATARPDDEVARAEALNRACG
ncbi:MAG TPA: molybdenum cofactor biosynthesis protein MoaE [Vicinamibacterales bacterium]|nr:molybdenum cofactor biosynthesis protein MoaE [Vicinamibacterales bacterium]